MFPNRIKRVNSLLREVLTEVIRRDLKNHELTELLSITSVDTTKDLRLAKVYISIITDDDELKKRTIQELQKCASRIENIAYKKVDLRYFPSLTFKLDESIEKYIVMDTLLQKIDDEKKHRGDPPSE